MAASNFYLIKASDADLIKTIKEISKKIVNFDFHCRTNSQVSLNAHSASLADNETLKKILSYKNSIIDSFQFQMGHVHISFQRGGFSDPRSAYYDEIKIQNNPQQHFQPLTDEQKLEFNNIIFTNLKAADPGKTISGGISKQQDELFSLHNEILTRLERSNLEITERHEEFRQKLEIEQTKKIDKLEKDYREKAAALETQSIQEHDRLKKKQEVFDARLEEVDDRNNTHARREIRKELLNHLQDRLKKFTVSLDTVSKRIPIHCICVVAILSFSYGTYYYTREFFEALNNALADARLNRADINWTSSPLMLFFVKQTVLTIGTLGFIVFYIKWMNRWFEKNANAEFKLRQFLFDMERASWIVETTLEWKKEGTAIPSNLIESLSGNLFAHEDESQHDEQHAIDSLASVLLGSTAKLKLRTPVGDGELELNQKGLKKLKAANA